MNTTMGVAIITYNSAGEIGPCLDAVCAFEAPVVVIDNASTDSTCDVVRAYPSVRLVVNPWNRGFAAAVNQAFDLLPASEALLLLNPDAVPQSFGPSLLEACNRPGAAAAAGKLTDQRGHAQRGFSLRRFPTAASLAFEALGINRLWPANPVNRRYRCLDLDPDVPAEVEQPAGAFLMIRREAWRTLGGFDERFFPLWFEDVDFLKRAREAGYRIYYVPGAAARHTGGHSLETLSSETRQLYWYDSLLKYAGKHFTGPSRRVLRLAVFLGSVFRTLFGIISSRSFRPLFVCRKVIGLGGSYLR